MCCSISIRSRIMRFRPPPNPKKRRDAPLKKSSIGAAILANRRWTSNWQLRAEWHVFYSTHSTCVALIEKASSLNQTCNFGGGKFQMKWVKQRVLIALINFSFFATFRELQNGKLVDRWPVPNRTRKSVNRLTWRGRWCKVILVHTRATRSETGRKWQFSNGNCLPGQTLIFRRPDPFSGRRDVRFISFARWQLQQKMASKAKESADLKMDAAHARTSMYFNGHQSF